MDVIIEYCGRYYSNTDLSMQLGELYGGDLYDIYWSEYESNTMCEHTVYYNSDEPDLHFDTSDELVQYAFSDYVVDLDSILKSEGLI